jgi:hypothetical protein
MREWRGVGGLQRRDNACEHRLVGKEVAQLAGHFSMLG